MTTKEKIVEKCNKIDSRFKIRSFKFHYLGLGVIVLAIPFTVILAQNQTNSSIRAQGTSDNVLAAVDPSMVAFQNEENPQEDKVAYVAPETALKAYDAATAKIDSVVSPKAVTVKPNIVIIMLDDVNPLDGRFWNQKITPNIYSTITSRAIRFDNYYGETSLCCPGRVGFLTGQHTLNHGVADLDGTKFKSGDTIATELKGAGYYTFLSGKYINGFSNIPQSKAVPPGWNKFDAIYQGQGQYYNYDWISTNSNVVHFGKTPADYSTDVIANAAIRALKAAPVAKPIFAYINPFAIHDVKTPAPRYIGDPRCKNIVSWKPPDYNEADVVDKPKYIQAIRQTNTDRPSTGFSLVTSCETMLAVDDLVGRVKKELIAQGRLNNTVFVLTADNGMAWGEHRWRNKTVPYATHLPLYIAWPAGRGVATRVDVSGISNIDFAPTLCEIGGCVMGPYPNGQELSDGLSFLPLLKDQAFLQARDAILEDQPVKEYTTSPYPPWYSVRTTDKSPLGFWHYIEYNDGEKELYDTSHGPCYNWTLDKGGDPCELNNLLAAGTNPSADTLIVASALSLRLSQLKAEKGYSAPIPSPSPTPTLIPTPTPSLSPSPTP